MSSVILLAFARTLLARRAGIVRRFALAAAALALASPAVANGGAETRAIAFVPLDDRPVTYQLPVLLGRISGQPVLTPPVASLGHYLTPGDPDRILDWLRSPPVEAAGAVVVSTDMIVYGGLVASRVPGLPAYVGYARLRRLVALNRAASDRPMSAFGTVMRLAPTGVPDVGAGADQWVKGADVAALQAYANLPDPPANAAQAARRDELAKKIGPALLGAYVGARARNLAVDEFVLQLTAEGDFDHVVLGQDDAGPVGLHTADIAALAAARERFGVADRTAIEPGADELGMALVAEAMARAVHWQPRVRVVYSLPGGGATQDRIEYVPVDVTVTRLIRACGAIRVDSDPDLTLYVRIAPTPPDDERRFVDAIATDVAAHRSVTVADLSFLYGGPGPEQQALVRDMIARGIAGRVDGFASWNTTANTVGTSLAAAIAAGAGRRSGRFDARELDQFLLDRYADDFAFHQFVRPELNSTLRAQGVDTTLLVGGSLAQADEINRQELWQQALALLGEIFPDRRDRGLTITLPWQRTFEAQLDVRLR